MRASIFTSDFASEGWARNRAWVFITALLLSVPCLKGGIGAAVWAADLSPASLTASGPQQDDFGNSPFAAYGEFNEEADEEEETRFLQYGRLFGASIGAGMEGITGNRAQLWKGGTVALDVRLHYWFDFNLALGMGLFYAPHYYSTTVQGRGMTTVNLSRLGAEIRYYVDTRDLASAISFANPFVLIGGGSFAKTETFQGRNTTATDSAFGLTFGGGLEFAIRPKKSYFQLEFKGHSVNFTDTRTSEYAESVERLADLSGLFYSITGNLLFTW